MLLGVYSDKFLVWEFEVQPSLAVIISFVINNQPKIPVSEIKARIR